MRRKKIEQGPISMSHIMRVRNVGGEVVCKESFFLSGTNQMKKKIVGVFLIR